MLPKFESFLASIAGLADGDLTMTPVPEGFCEVVTVPATDELPYVFEMAAGQGLTVSISASAELDLILCEEATYDKWIDSGLQAAFPQDPILALRAASQHGFDYRMEHHGVLFVVLINRTQAPIDVLVAATVSG